MVAGLPRVVTRLASIEFTCLDGLDSIRSADETYGPNIVHYCDPPYLHSTRSQPKAYAREMTTDQHAELLALLRTIKGTVLLSGYQSPLYASELRDWRRIDWNLPNHSGQGQAKQGRVESLWSNHPL
jgi:DNA adenine methylase